MTNDQNFPFPIHFLFAYTTNFPKCHWHHIDFTIPVIRVRWNAPSECEDWNFYGSAMGVYKEVGTLQVKTALWFYFYFQGEADAVRDSYEEDALTLLDNQLLFLNRKQAVRSDFCLVQPVFCCCFVLNQTFSWGKLSQGCREEEPSSAVSLWTDVCRPSGLRWYFWGALVWGSPVWLCDLSRISSGAHHLL